MNNNILELLFRGVTNQIETLIGLNNAGGIVLARKNDDFNINRSYARNKNKGKMGYIYNIYLLIKIL